MTFLEIYAIICLGIYLVLKLSLYNVSFQMKLDNRYEIIKSNLNFIQKIFYTITQSLLTLLYCFIPLFNLILLFLALFGQDRIKEKVIEDLKSQGRLHERT